MGENDLNKNIINAISDTIKNEIDELYKNYKDECIKNLNEELEIKKPEIVSKILENTQYVVKQDPLNQVPTILIKIEYKH